ncbi:MAG: DUF3467 domain-containing protein [Chloroflexi bacterium]|nr:DUF3467 domain-containing protein [Chloroflexota bacterium]
MADKPSKKQLKIEVASDLQPIYVNFAIINHNYNEIVLDFAHVMPNLPAARIQARLVLTPYHAKLLLQALQTGLANYEKRFGEIKVRGSQLPDRPTMGFDPHNIN